MPDFEVSGPDGARYQITAPDEAAAMAAFSTLQKGSAENTDPRFSDSAAVGGKFLEGVPVGGAFVPQAGAAISALAQPLTGVGAGGTLGERYAKNLEQEKAQSKAFEEQNPGVSTTAKVLGGVASYGGALKAIPALASPLGFTGTVPQMAAKGLASGAAIAAADAAARGGDVLHEAGIGGVVGAAAGPAGRAVGKIYSKIRPGAAAEPVPVNTVRVGDQDVRVPPQDLKGASALEMAGKDSSGAAAKVEADAYNAAVKADLDKATEAIAADLSGMGPNAGRVGGSVIEDAANAVRTHAQGAEASRASAEELTARMTALEAERLRGRLAPDPYTGRPMQATDSPYAAAETVGEAVAQRRDAGLRGVRRNYDEANAVPGTFDPAVPRTMAEEIRTRINSGSDPLWVDPQSTSKANEALKILDQHLGTGLFRNTAAARPVGPVQEAAARGVSEAERALAEMTAKGINPERARAAIERAALPGADKLGGRGALEPHTVAVADGSTIEVRPKIVEAGSVKTSADVGYDKTLQPRDRKRAQSDMQVNDIAKNLSPQRLGASAEADRGAPIVGADGMIESGNGRMLAIRQAYMVGGPEALRYRAYLASEGADISGFKMPVLVRERVTPMTPDQRKAFTVAANQSSTLSLSAPERALADSRALTPDTLGLIRNPGDLGAVENRDFVRQFMGTLPQAERGALTTKAGDLSAEGLTRVRNAVLAKAYGDSPVLARVAEATNDEVKSISSGLMQAAPEWAQLRAGVASGQVPKGLDVTADLLDAVERTARIRGKGASLAEGRAQTDAFAKQTPESERIMRLFYDADGAKAAPASQVGNGLRDYAQQAAKVDAAPGLDLGLAPVTARDILDGTLAKANAPKALAAEVKAAAEAPPAAATVEPAAEELPPIGVREMDAARKRLNVLRKEAERKAVMQGEGSDLRAIDRIIREFDKIEGEAFASGKFSGDADAARALRERARASHGEQRETFSSRGGADSIGRSVEKILGRYGDTAATPDQILQLSYGSAADPGGGAAAQVGQRLRQIVGPTSAEWGAYKQGLFDHVRGTGSPAEQGARIEQFLTGSKGRTLGEMVLSADERAAMRAHGQSLIASEPVKLSSLKGVDRMMAKITGRLDGVPSSNEEIIQRVFGSPKTPGGAGESKVLVDHLKVEMNPEALGQLREAGLRHAMTRQEGVTEWGPKLIAENIHKMRASSAGLSLYTPKQLKGMGELADAYMKLVPPAGAVNTSNSATVGAKLLKSTMGLFLPALGAASHGPMGVVAGMAGNKAASGIQNARAARSVRSLLYAKQPNAAVDPRFARAGALLTRGAAQGQIEGGR